MPAAFNVQNDLGTMVDANAYITIAFYRQHFLDRGTDYAAIPDATIQKGIVLATDYVDMRWGDRFAGGMLVVDGTQATQFPRTNAYRSKSGLAITGIPVELKKAVAEYALRATTAPLLVDGPTPIVGGEQQPTGEVLSTSVTVGPISESKTYGSSQGGYGTGTILINGCYFITIPAADLWIEVLIDQVTRQRRAIRA